MLRQREATAPDHRRRHLPLRRGRGGRANRRPVLNDGTFGWAQWIQRRALDGRILATTFDPTIDIVAIARASGCDAVRVCSPDELSPALDRAKRANADGVPFVVDVSVDQSHHHAEFDRFHGFEPAATSATV